MANRLRNPGRFGVVPNSWNELMPWDCWVEIRTEQLLLKSVQEDSTDWLPLQFSFHQQLGWKNEEMKQCP